MPNGPTKRRGRPPRGGREAILTAALELLHKRGIGRLTTREIAHMAGVSEASIFYHYNDRAGLLTAVFQEGVRPLQALKEDGGLSASNPGDLMSRLGPAIEQFLDQTLPVLIAAQSDPELRDTLSAYMQEQDLGPHRGVQALGDYLAREQAAGRVRRDIDCHAVALTFVGTCFMRASQSQLPVSQVTLPPLGDVVAGLERMLCLPDA
jgi:AcrR family transcriptional regulator